MPPCLGLGLSPHLFLNPLLFWGAGLLAAHRLRRSGIMNSPCGPAGAPIANSGGMSPCRQAGRDDLGVDMVTCLQFRKDPVTMSVAARDAG